MQNTTTEEKKIWEILESVCDPEIPVLTVADLGIVRAVNIAEDGATEVVITPTYSGCPAMNTIEINIRAALEDRGYSNVRVRSVLSPAWTTDWISEQGREKLRAYGIAPPVGRSSDKSSLFSEAKSVACPRCNSTDTRMLSQFGSTACKSLYQCNSCKEPFDYFKCH